jgi:putative long chain acyl-CoA synthase
MPLLPNAIREPAARLGAAAQNALEVARFGGLDTGEEASPFEVVAETRIYRLRRYFAPTSKRAAKRPPVVLVPPMMLAADVYDVAPTASAVAILHDNGIDPYVVDFGSPEHEEGGLERTLADHVLAVSEIVDRVHEITGRDVHLAGYSQGGMFCYQTAAYRRSKGVASVITFGSPVDTRGVMTFGLPEELVTRGGAFLAEHVLARRALPAWASRTGFRLLDPMKAVRQRLDFMLQLHDRDALLPRERQRRFLNEQGWVAWPGPALADFMKQFVLANRMVSGGFVIEGRLVTLADISCPVLYAVGEVDEIAPAPAVRAITPAAPRADVYELPLTAGHFGLVVGRAASTTTWPTVADWAKWDRKGQPPDGIRRPQPENNDRRVGARLNFGVELAAGTGARLARGIADTSTRAIHTVRELSREAASQLPRLIRLEQIGPRTRISMGVLLQERADRAPDDVCFLFEDRAYANGPVNERIDNVVRGLISIGIRQGEHVGVLMGTRPSGLAVVAALSRLGAVAVLLRPDGDIAREVELGGVGRIIADPEHGQIAADVRPVHVFVLGGGGEPRELEGNVTDLERVDPGAVQLPAWYRPNPGLASDLAFILFTGQGERTRVNRITNRRFALSAFGTASSAALSPADTVYSVTPLYHPSGLLMSIGGALAGGARIAMARDFDPATFWEEVRRYGVTVGSYTWTLLHDLVEAPPDPAERGHPVRLFIGSGMPRGLWRRACERFAPVGILEFWTSTDGDAILVNLSGAKIGAMGRRLPGSPEVRVARYHVGDGRLIEGRDGFAIECEDDETGVLLMRVRPELTPTATPLRGVFSRGDAWMAAGDLFRRDRDGDHWLVEHIPALVPTKDGLVPTLPAAEALGDDPAVDLAVGYGVPVREGIDVTVVAVALRRGKSLDARAIGDALRDVDHKPAVVHVVDEMPVTTWYRPLTTPLRAAGLPPAGERAWALDARGAYRPLSEAARRRLRR